MEVGTLTRDDFIDNDEMYVGILDIEDEVQKAKLIAKLADRAKEVGAKTQFQKILQAHKKKYDELKRRQNELDKKKVPELDNNIIAVTGVDEEYKTGFWSVTDEGVTKQTEYGTTIVCYHPIFPTTRFSNLQTGKEKIRVKFKKGHIWKDVIVDKSTIASASKIVQLSDFGVSVTSETAKSLVKYMCDFENLNIDVLDYKQSSSKLGWIKDKFIPFDNEIEIDCDSHMKGLTEAINENGSRDEWINLVKEIRNSNRIEPKIYLAASLASVLLEPLNALPSIVNLWGETGKGKTVALMLATSVWGNPANDGGYMVSPKSSNTAFEVRMNFLNNLPLAVDDIAQISKTYNQDLSDFIYLLCSGQGRERSNVNLGLNSINTWKNVILTNSEHSLVTEITQGGAINRVIDVEMAEGPIFENGNLVANTLRKNYGFIGREFVDLIRKIGIEEIKKIQTRYVENIKKIDKDKEEKKILPMSIILTADYLADMYIFNDGNTLDIETCCGLLADKNRINENERAYQNLIGMITVNSACYDKARQGEPILHVGYQLHGRIEKYEVVIIKTIFDKYCEEINCNITSFLSWAKKRSLIQTDSKGRSTVTRRFDGNPSRCVVLKLPNDSDEWMQPCEEKIPFKF